MSEKEFELIGVDELLRKFAGISDEIRYKGGRFALRKAARVIAKKAEVYAQGIDDPTTPEKIYKNIAIRWSRRTFKRTGNLKFRIGILGGAQTPDTLRKIRRRQRRNNTALSDLGELSGKGKLNLGGDTFYWRFIEFDTKYTGENPFLRPALINSRGEASRVFVYYAKKAIDRAIKKKNKISPLNTSSMWKLGL